MQFQTQGSKDIQPVWVESGSPATPAMVIPLQHCRTSGTVQKFSTSAFQPGGAEPPEP